jgi:Galactose oxidase, central domain
MKRAVAAVGAMAALAVPARATPPWSQPGAAEPPPRAAHSMVYDLGRARTVLFSGDGALADTWEYDGATWTQVTTIGSPPARAHYAMAYDGARARVVLFGGNTLSPTMMGNPALADTWEYDGATTTWTRVTTTGNPPGRSTAAMVYDSARAQAVLFGGQGFTASFGSSSLGDTWEYDGAAATWTEALTSRPGCIGHAMAYDSARARIVLFGGMCTTDNFGDNWEYDPAAMTWHDVDSKTVPAPRSFHAMAYDVVRARSVLFGGCCGAGGGGPFGDTWEYDGALAMYRVVPSGDNGNGCFRNECSYSNARLPRRFVLIFALALVALALRRLKSKKRT